MVVLLRFGDVAERAEVGEPGPDGVVFVSFGHGFMPFRDTGERDEDGLPVFDYCL